MENGQDTEHPKPKSKKSIMLYYLIIKGESLKAKNVRVVVVREQQAQMPLVLDIVLIVVGISGN